MYERGVAELTVLQRNRSLHHNPLLLYPDPLTSQFTHTIPPSSTHTYWVQSSGCPAPLYLHEAEIMASVAAPFVRAVPGPCSLLVPISWLLACWPLYSTLCCLSRKYWRRLSLPLTPTVSFLLLFFSRLLMQLVLLQISV